MKVKFIDFSAPTKTSLDHKNNAEGIRDGLSVGANLSRVNLYTVKNNSQNQRFFAQQKNQDKSKMIKNSK